MLTNGYWQIVCVEDKKISEEYHDPTKRFIGNALTITLNDGTVMPEVHIDFPVGHMRRREEGTPILNAKFKRHIAPHFPAAHVEKSVLSFRFLVFAIDADFEFA